MSLAWIPKGTLEKIRKICSHFIWSGSGDKFTQPWEKWDLLARPKALGGWGLKNIFLFSKALAAKTGWHLISNNNLWSTSYHQKYIAPETVEDWIRSQTSHTNKAPFSGKLLFPPFQ
jgi:hypothetical protein